jgi:hypothetical protein
LNNSLHARAPLGSCGTGRCPQRPMHATSGSPPWHLPGALRVPRARRAGRCPPAPTKSEAKSRTRAPTCHTPHRCRHRDPHTHVLASADLLVLNTSTWSVVTSATPHPPPKPPTRHIPHRCHHRKLHSHVLASADPLVLNTSTGSAVTGTVPLLAPEPRRFLPREPALQRHLPSPRVPRPESPSGNGARTRTRARSV